jgi:glutamine synthetase
MKPEEILKYCQDKGIQFVDLKFNDLPGLWQHFSITLSELNDDFWKGGIGFDGSSIRGF